MDYIILIIAGVIMRLIAAVRLRRALHARCKKPRQAARLAGLLHARRAPTCAGAYALPAVTSMRRGRVSSRRGIVSVSTPSRRFASILDVSRSGLSTKVRA